jgi:hypothetical protein
VLAFPVCAIAKMPNDSLWRDIQKMHLTKAKKLKKKSANSNSKPKRKNPKFALL